MCSDVDEHRRRVESRVSDIPGHRLPTWDEVMSREYVPWNREHIVLDTAANSLNENVEMVRKAIRDTLPEWDARPTH
jgi:hypothetical protein